VRRPQVLCVDDLPDHLQLRMELLRRLGCDAMQAHDHQSALRVAADRDIDLCITDYHLQNGETGEDIARDLRLLRPRAALILFTGDAEIARSVRKSFDAVLIKGQAGASTLRKLIKEFIVGRGHRPNHHGVVRPAPMS
jgi:CheY-like chemotaxis protein